MSILTNSQDAPAKWLIFSQLGVWVLSVAGTFVIAPPLLHLTDESVTKNLVRFLVAALAAILYISVRSKSRAAHYRLWRRTAIISLVIGVAITTGYNYMINNWSVDFYGATLVTGKVMYPEAQQQKERIAKEMNKPFIDDETFVKARTGETQYIWPANELKERFYIMTVTYILAILALAVFLLSITQAIFCYEKAHPD